VKGISAAPRFFFSAQFQHALQGAADTKAE